MKTNNSKDRHLEAKKIFGNNKVFVQFKEIVYQLQIA